MRTILLFPVLCLTPLLAAPNVAPTPVIVSAAMRADSTIMDVVYRVNDPDDATVKVRALAFINGTRSFANVIKPTAFVEGSGARLGDAIATNTDHALAWDVAVDWNIDVGQLKFEVLALDGRGLLQFDWISIPAAGGNPALTISKDTPPDNKVLDAMFWQYASGDPGIALASGVVTGTAASGVYKGVPLVNGASLGSYGIPYILKQMNLDPAGSGDMSYANTTARAGLLNTGSWHAANRVYAGTSMIFGWGIINYVSTADKQASITAIAASLDTSYPYNLALCGDGTVVGWGYNDSGKATIPAGHTGVTAIAAGVSHSLALKSDGTVVGWGNNGNGQTTIPSGLTGVTAIAAGGSYSLALKSDGTVVGWGYNGNGQTTPPAGLTGVTAIAAGGSHSLALKSDGTVVGWGYNGSGQTTIPSGLTGVTAIAAGGSHSLALKSDGTVVGWGNNDSGKATPPAGLTGVTAIAAGVSHSLALKIDGAVVGWGYNGYGQTTIPAGLTGVTAIAAGGNHSLAMKAKAP